MNEAPERIWFDRNMRLDHQAPILYQSDREDDDIEYIRADLARLPEELIERLVGATNDGFDDQSAWSLFNDILAWHEQQEGGK